MTGTDLCVNKLHKSRSYLNHLVETIPWYMRASVVQYMWYKIIKL
jgi:hypothetical protein